VHLENINWDKLFERLEIYNVLEMIANMETQSEDGRVIREIEKVPLYVR